MAASLRTDLGLDALDMALLARGGELPGLIITAIAVPMYLAIRYTERLAEADVANSVGSKGDSCDCETRWPRASSPALRPTSSTAASGGRTTRHA